MQEWDALQNALGQDVQFCLLSRRRVSAGEVLGLLGDEILVVTAFEDCAKDIFRHNTTPPERTTLCPA
jgi:hypothetical protein